MLKLLDNTTQLAFRLNNVGEKGCLKLKNVSGVTLDEPVVGRKRPHNNNTTWDLLLGDGSLETGS